MFEKCHHFYEPSGFITVFTKAFLYVLAFIPPQRTFKPKTTYVYFVTS